MCDEAQRYITEARARAMNRLVREAEVNQQPQPSPTRRGGQTSPAPAPACPRVCPPQPEDPEPFFSLPPPSSPDPQTRENMQRTLNLSLNPVPAPDAVPRGCIRDYSANLEGGATRTFCPPGVHYPTPPGMQCQELSTYFPAAPPGWVTVMCRPTGGQAQAQFEQLVTAPREIHGGYEDPELWYQLQEFDPVGLFIGVPGQGLSEYGTSYYDILSQMREPEPDVSGGVEDVIGRARHRAMLKAGIMDPTPCPPWAESRDFLAAEAEQPPLDEILRGAPQIDIPPEMDGAWGPAPPDEAEADEDILDDVLPPGTYEDLGADFAYRAAKEMTPKTDAFGLPYRRYPTVEAAHREERRRRRAEMLRRQQEAALAEEREQQRVEAEMAARAAQEAAAAAAAAARRGPQVTSARPGPRGGVCPRPGSSGAQTRTPSRGPPATRAATPSRPPSSRGQCPQKTPFQLAAEEKAAKAAAALEAHKKRTQYQAPKLKSRPPTKPPTTPKAPRGLDKRGDRRGQGPDPTRSGPPGYYQDYDYPVEMTPMEDIPQPVPYDPVYYCPMR